MKNNLIVATHHKTGTVWMDGVFRAMAQDFGIRFIDYQADRPRLCEYLREPFILLSNDGDFSAHSGLLERRDVRILHVIRDPRDILISAMHYHKRAREDWLHQRGPRYRGMTYQQALRSRRGKFEGYVFEMENSTACTLDEVRHWRYGRPNCFEARYEALREDTDLVYWRRILAFLDLDEREKKMAVQRFWQNSLFGGLSRLGNNHVRSGAVAQWKGEFTVRLGYAFSSRFPGLLQTLRYERDARWILDLPLSEPSRVAAQLGVALAGAWPLLAPLTRGLMEI